MVEPLACVLRGLHETGVEIGDTVAVIGGGPIGLMFMQVGQADRVQRDRGGQARFAGGRCEAFGRGRCNPDHSGPRSGRRRARFYARPARRRCGHRGSRPPARLGNKRSRWFARAAPSTSSVAAPAAPRSQLDTNRLHYSEDHAESHVPSHAGERAQGIRIDCREEDPRRRITLPAKRRFRDCSSVLHHMMNRNGDIKTAIIPGH